MNKQQKSKYTTKYLIDKINNKEIKNEEELRSIFTKVMRDSFDVDISNFERKTTHGRTDALYNTSIIEFKAPGRLSNEVVKKEAIKQVKSYQSKKFPNLYIFDGKEIIFFNGMLKITTEPVNETSMIYFAESLKLSKKDSIEINQVNIESKLSPTNPDVKKILKDIYKAASVNDYDSEEFKAWRKLFSIANATDISKTDKAYLNSVKISELQYIFGEGTVFGVALFSLHTYFSIVAKNILFNHLQTLKIIETSHEGTLEIVEEGSFFNENKIYNMYSKDMFSWYLKDEGLVSDITSFQVKTLKKLKSYDINNMSTDFLHDIYETIIPHNVRKSLGEYYTPKDLVDELWKFSNINPKSKIMDPTCGSGTFLVKTINEKIRDNQTLEEIINSFAGMDINPLAILAAKVNLLIKLSPLRTKEIKKPIFIPVFNLDSTKLLDDVEHNLLRKPSAEIMLDWKNPNKIRANIYEYLEFEKKSGHKNIEIHLSSLKEMGEEKIEETLFKLHKIVSEKSVNSDEKYHINQSIYAATLVDFDFIIGNPPWVKWSNLPGEYREELKGKGVAEIFSPFKNSGGNSLDLYAPILWATTKNFLAKNGVVAMLMPMSLNYNSSMHNMRKFTFMPNGQKISRIQDYASNISVFKGVSINFGIYVIDNSGDLEYTKVSNAPKGETGKIVRKKMYPHRFEQSNVIAAFDSEKQFKRVSKFIGARTTEYKVRSGVQFSPNKLRQFRKIEENRNLVRLSSAPIRKEQKQGVSTLDFWAEKDAIVQVFRTADLRGTSKHETYSWWLYKDGTKDELDFEEVQRRFPVLAGNLEALKKQIAGDGSSKFNDRISRSSWYGNTRVGNYTQAPYRICFPDNGKFKPVLLTDTRVITEGHVRFIPIYKKEDAERIFKILNTEEVQILIDKQSLKLNKSFRDEYMNIKF